MELTHVRLLVMTFDACVRFYRDVMDFRVLWGGEGSGYAAFEAGTGAKVALVPRQEQAEAVGTDHADWGIQTAYLRDPDGTLIELNGAMPRDQWSENLVRSAERWDHAGASLA